MGRDRRDALGTCLGNALGRLNQAERIGQGRISAWATEAVESAMAAVTRSWRIPPPESADPAAGSPSAWDGTGYPQWQEVRNLLADEVDSLAGFTPAEAAGFLVGSDTAWHLRRAVQAKLLRSGATTSWPGRWRGLRRRLGMKLTWRGGQGLNPDDGWTNCPVSLERLAGSMAVHPATSFLPGLLRQPGPGRTVGRTGWTARHPLSPGSGRLVLVEYLYPGRRSAAAVASGIIPEEAKLQVSIQFARCVDVRIVPTRAGVCVYDQEEQRWHFHDVQPSLKTGRGAIDAARGAWDRHVMTGQPPIAAVPEPQPAESGMAEGEAARLARAWIAGLVVAAGRETEEEARRELQAGLKARIPANGRKLVSPLKDICIAELERKVTEEDLSALGLDPESCRTPSDGTSVEVLLAEIGRLHSHIGQGRPTAEDVWTWLGELMRSPPPGKGPIDTAAAMDLLGDRVAELPEVALRIRTSDSRLRRRLADRMRNGIDELIAAAEEEVNSGEPGTGKQEP